MQRTICKQKSCFIILLLFVLAVCGYAKTKDKETVLEPLEYSFSVRRDDVIYDTLKIYNKSQEVINISKIIKGCSCTKISYQPGPIAPNEYLEIKLEIDAKGKRVGDSETKLLIKYTSGKDSVEQHCPVKIKYKVLPSQKEGSVYASPDSLRCTLPETGIVKRYLIIRDNSGNPIKLQKVYTDAGNVKITRVIRRYADKYIIILEISKAAKNDSVPKVYIKHEKGIITVPIIIRDYLKQRQTKRDPVEIAD